MSANFTTPVGRIVAGDCHTVNAKDMMGQPLTVKKGPNIGQPRVEYYLALAIAKTEPTWVALWTQFSEVAREGYPALFDTQGQCLAPRFAWKITDGDDATPNQKGTRPCDREGYPGHYVISFSSGFAPKCYDSTGGLIDPETIKRGHYVRVGGSVSPNGKPGDPNPGLFVGHGMIQLCGFGPEINVGADPNVVFAAPIGALPAGASSTPLAPAVAPGGAPAAPPAPPAAALAPAAPPAPPAGVQPAPGFLAGPPAPAAPEPKHVAPDGSVWARSQLMTAGYTEAQIAQLPPAV
jgi:hypothetical protein